MPKYRTIHKFAVEYGFPEYRLRQWVKQKRVPGWRSGNRFMVDTQVFLEQLRDESIKAQEIGIWEELPPEVPGDGQ